MGASDRDLNPYKFETQETVQTPSRLWTVVRSAFLCIFCFLLFSPLLSIEVDRLNANDVPGIIQWTLIGSLVAAVAVAVAWGISGELMRRKGLPLLAGREALRFLGGVFGAVVLCFAIIPSVLEACSASFPVSENTISYFSFLFAGMFLLMVNQAVKYRRHPSRQSACIVCLGAFGVTVISLIMGFIFMAVAASALT